MGLANYSIAELDTVTKSNPIFQDTFIQLETDILNLCNQSWAPKTNGYLTPENSQYGRTTILPALFNNALGVQMQTWRQIFGAVGAVAPLITGAGLGGVLAEDFKVAWIGVALPNDSQMFTELRWQIGDQRYGRLDLEEIRNYKVPALIFEKGQIIDGKQNIQIDGFLEGPIPAFGAVPNATFPQRVVLLGSAYYKQADRVLGNPGAAIPSN